MKTIYKYYALIFLCTFSVTALAASPEVPQDRGPLADIIMSSDSTYYEVLSEAFKDASTGDNRETLHWLGGEIGSTYEELHEYYKKRREEGWLDVWRYTNYITGRCFSSNYPNHARNTLVVGAKNNIVGGPGLPDTYKVSLHESPGEAANYFDKLKSPWQEQIANKVLYSKDRGDPLSVLLGDEGIYAQGSMRRFTFRSGKVVGMASKNNDFLLLEVALVNSKIKNVTKYCYFFKKIATITSPN